MPGIIVSLPPMVPLDLPEQIDKAVTEALEASLPIIEALMRGPLSRVPIDTGDLRRSHFASIGLGGDPHKLSLWWTKEYASYLIEHAGVWKARTPGTELDWRPWAMDWAYRVVQTQISLKLLQYGLEIDWEVALRGFRYLG